MKQEPSLFFRRCRDCLRVHGKGTGCQLQPCCQGSGKPSGIPLLTGTLTGPIQEYDQGPGFADYPDFAAEMNVMEQKGRTFAGLFISITNGTVSAFGFPGEFWRDGRTHSLTEKESGYCTGQSSERLKSNSYTYRMVLLNASYRLVDANLKSRPPFS